MTPLEPVAAGDLDDPADAAEVGPPRPPEYDGGTLASVLPAVAASLGATAYDGADPFGLVPARRAVVVLVDGLGLELLRRRGGHAPFLRSHLPDARPPRLPASPRRPRRRWARFGTGLPPGAHGLVGYEVLVPGEDRTVNELSWEDGPDPRTWQPARRSSSSVEADGVAVTRIGPALLRRVGPDRRRPCAAAASSRPRHLPDRVDAALAARRGRSPRALVYLYWGDLDKVGHVHGCGSWEWGDELEAIDGALAELARRVPADTAVYVTADHGMVDAPARPADRPRPRPELAARRTPRSAASPRSPQLYCEPGAAADVLATWTSGSRRGPGCCRREEAVADGLVRRPVREDVLPRIGDVVVAHARHLRRRPLSRTARRSSSPCAVCTARVTRRRARDPLGAPPGPAPHRVSTRG